jgi:hypothetical protein
VLFVAVKGGSARKGDTERVENGVSAQYLDRCETESEMGKVAAKNARGRPMCTAAKFGLSTVNLRRIVIAQVLLGGFVFCELVRASPVGYVDSLGVNYYKTDFGTGSQTLVNAAPITDGPLGHIAISPDGNFLYVAGGSFLGRTDTRSGEYTNVGRIGDFPGGGGPILNISFGNDGNLYGITLLEAELYRINTATGKGTSLGYHACPSTYNVQGFAVMGNKAIVLRDYGLSTVDLGDGTAQDLGGLANAYYGRTLDVAVGPGGVLYAWNGFSFYDVDLQTMRLREVQQLQLPHNGWFFTLTPEPATLSLLCLGGLLLFRRRPCR